MNVGIASDHAGFQLKEQLKTELKNMGVDITDYGTNSEDSCDYPDFAHPLAKSIGKENELGIAICGSGNGINMTLNKYPHIRSAIVWNKELSELARQHNNANIIALPARFIDLKIAIESVKQFLETSFEGGRHQRRVEKISI
ncbi:MAG: ribose-5-phosphate isomerase [Verrucomicrobia bacterium]|nr:ribose-5-phosphate isomerase [Verrucomicrobiota bacterium]